MPNLRIPTWRNGERFYDLADQIGTPEEKVEILAEKARERGEPFDKAKELRILKGAKRTPYVAVNGETFNTEKAKDARNKEIYKELGKWSRDESSVNPLPWLLEILPQSFDKADWLARRDPGNAIDFEEAWAEARQELIDSKGYTFENGVLREVPFFGEEGRNTAFVSFTIQRPNVFVRFGRSLWAFVKEAIK